MLHYVDAQILVATGCQKTGISINNDMPINRPIHVLIQGAFGFGGDCHMSV